MKFRKLGLEWGAAYSEAQPVHIKTAGGAEVILFEGENGDLIIQAPQSAHVEIGTTGNQEGYVQPVLQLVVEDGFNLFPYPKRENSNVS